MEATAQIFLSYAREDKEKVEELYQKLSDAGFKPWMDKKDILPGARWQYSIRKAIRGSDFFLVCLSANSVNKRGWVQREMKQALDILQEKLDSDIYLIPVRLEDCEAPESLHDFQWVDLFEESSWELLVKAIRVGMDLRATGIKPTPEKGPEQPVTALPTGAERFLEAKERQKVLIKKLAELKVVPRVPGWAWGAVIGGIILLAVMGRVLIAGREGRVKPLPTGVQAAIPSVASPVSSPVPATPTPPPPTATPVPTATPLPVMPTAIPPTASPTLTATKTPTHTPVPPTAKVTDTPRSPTPTPAPTVIPQPAGPIALTIYLRGTRTETGFAALSSDQPNGGMIYEKGQFVYGEAAVQIGDTVYHFDKPEVGPGEPEQLPDPWRVEFEFAETLVARTGKQAGFNAKKAQFWVGILDEGSAVGEERPYSLTMKLYEGNELRKSIQVSFTVADAPESPGSGGDKSTPP